MMSKPSRKKQERRRKKKLEKGKTRLALEQAIPRLAKSPVRPFQVNKIVVLLRRVARWVLLGHVRMDLRSRLLAHFLTLRSKINSTIRTGCEDPTRNGTRLYSSP